MKKVKVTPWTDELILKNSFGRVETPGLYDARRDRPVIGGLLCERIFGPMKNFCCSCGQLRGAQKNAGKRCNTCKVEVVSSSVRREREAHIELECYVLPHYAVYPTSSFLGISIKALELIISGKRMVDLVAQGEEHQWGSSVKDVKVHKNVILVDGTTANFISAERKKNCYESGATHLRELATNIDSRATLELRELGSCQTTASYLKWNPELEVTDLFLSKFLVMPADLRPINIKEGSNNVESGINILYRNVMMKAAQLSVIKEDPSHRNAPEAMFVLQCLIQKSIRSLIKDGYESRHAGKIESIGDGLKDKSGRFRENLLGKRVDYSGRSFITPDPALDIDQCGIPEYMAIELLRPFIIAELRKSQGMTIRGATNAWKARRPAAFEAMHKILANNDDPHLVMLNRAPSLHRYSVQGLKMVVHKGKSIKIPPEICSPKNADFDGDTEAVHLVLTKVARDEVRRLIMPQANLISYANTAPIYSLSHEMIVGIYYLTYDAEVSPTPIAALTRKAAISEWEKARLYGSNLPVQTKVKLKTPSGWIDTTVGRCIVEETMQTAPGYITKGLDKGGINKMLKDCIEVTINNPDEVLRRTKAIRNLGFEWSTKMGLSIAPEDCAAPEGMTEVMAEAEEFEKNARTEEEAARNWAKVTHHLEEMWLDQTKDTNNLKFMYMTKSRVSPIQLRQMCIMKGQIAGAAGDIVLVKNSLMSGLTPYEYSLTCKGARSSFGANNEVVPQSGYFCRQSVHALRELHVAREGNTWAKEGIMVKGMDALGRFDMEGDMITLSTIEEMGPDFEFEVQSVVTGIGPIATHELGIDWTKHLTFQVGTPLGVIAASSFAEKSTQLGLRQKHLSGAIEISESSDKRVDVMRSGKVTAIEETARMTRVTIEGLTYTYHTEFVTMIKTPKVGMMMEKGDTICVYSDSLTGAAIAGMLAQLIKFLGANNPGKTFNFPRALVSPVSGQVKHVVRKVEDKYDYYSNTTEEFVMEGKHYPSETREVTSDYECEAVDIIVGDRLIGTVNEKNALLIPSGSMVEAGTQLTYGLPDVFSYYQMTESITETWKMFKKNLTEIHGGFQPIIYEMFFRAMTEICFTHNGTKILRSMMKEGDEAIPAINGINGVTAEYPSLLKQLAFSHIDMNLSKSLKVLRESTPMPSECVMMGGLVPSPVAKSVKKVTEVVAEEVSHES